MYCRQVKLLSTERVSESYFRIGFDCEEIAAEAHPGQFLMVRLMSPSWEYLLSRPFSFCRVDGSRIELLFNVVGKGTRSLSEAKTGEILEILGPLGNGFSFEGVSRAILGGGGMGIAPLPFLASELAKRRPAVNVTVLLGARTAASLCLLETFSALGARVEVATDDGAAGYKGLVTDLLEKELKSGKDDRLVVYACGPKPMLQTIARFTEEHSVPCQVSVEERMGCGVGACMACACKTRDEQGNEHFKRVCLEGPVFDVAELIFDED